MGRDQNAGCGIVAALLLVAFFVLFALGVGGIFFMRASTMQRVQAERMVLEAEEATLRAMADARTQEAAATATTAAIEAETELADVVTTTIRLAADGALKRDGTASDWDQLRAHLRASAHAKFVVEVDPQCSFEKLSELLQVFAEAGVPQPLLRTAAAP